MNHHNNSPSRLQFAVLLCSGASLLWACTDSLSSTPSAPPLPSGVADVAFVSPPTGDVAAASDLTSDDRDASPADTSQGDGSSPDGSMDVGLSDGDTVVTDGSSADLTASDLSDLTPDLTPSCMLDRDCNNGNFCDGMERCLAGTCEPPTGPQSAGRYCINPNTAVECDGAGGRVGERLGCMCDMATGECIASSVVFGENSGDVTGTFQDSAVDGGSPTSNFDESNVGGYGFEVDDNDFFWFRVDLSSLPAGSNLVGIEVELKLDRFIGSNTSAADIVIAVGADTTPMRDWVESGATFNTYDGTNAWTGGADGGVGDREANAAEVTVQGSDLGQVLVWTFDSNALGLVQARFDAGVAPMFTVFHGNNGSGYQPAFVTSEGVDGDRPRFRVTYSAP